MGTSPQYALNKHDIVRVGWVLLHAVLAYALTEIVQLIPSVDFGQYSTLVMLGLMPVLQAAQRYVDAPVADPVVTPPAA